MRYVVYNAQTVNGATANVAVPTAGGWLTGVLLTAGSRIPAGSGVGYGQAIAFRNYNVAPADALNSKVLAIIHHNYSATGVEVSLSNQIYVPLTPTRVDPSESLAIYATIGAGGVLIATVNFYFD